MVLVHHSWITGFWVGLFLYCKDGIQDCLGSCDDGERDNGRMLYIWKCMIGR